MTTTLRDQVGLPLALGGDVFGWTADAKQTFAVLDGFVAAGGRVVDTADVYNAWAPGHRGGESETLIGEWLRGGRGRRDHVLLASKVSQHPDLRGLAPSTVRRAIDASLLRLGTDVVDLYYAHYDDPSVPVAEIAGVFSELVDEGKIRWIGASNFEADRLSAWVGTATSQNLHAPAAYQPLYNLLERDFEHGTGPVAAAADLAVFPYSALAGGFLTGKYRPGAQVESRRTDGTSRYSGPLGERILETLRLVAAAHDVTPAAVAVAWLRSRPGVAAPISSARTLPQLASTLAGAALDLTTSEAELLTRASGA